MIARPQLKLLPLEHCWKRTYVQQDTEYVHLVLANYCFWIGATFDKVLDEAVRALVQGGSGHQWSKLRLGVPSFDMYASIQKYIRDFRELKVAGQMERSELGLLDLVERRYKWPRYTKKVMKKNRTS